MIAYIFYAVEKHMVIVALSFLRDGCHNFCHISITANHPIQLIAATTNHPESCIQSGCLYPFINRFCIAAIKITANATGRISPLTAPAKISNCLGLPINTKIIVVIIIKREMHKRSYLAKTGCNV